MPEYRINVERKTTASGETHSPGGTRLQLIKAGILTFLAVSAIVGIALAAFVVGSIIASVLLIVLAVAIFISLVRGLYLKFRGRKTNALSPKN